MFKMLLKIAVKRSVLVGMSEALIIFTCLKTSCMILPKLGSHAPVLYPSLKIGVADGAEADDKTALGLLWLARTARTQLARGWVDLSRGPSPYRSRVVSMDVELSPKKEDSAQDDPSQKFVRDWFHDIDLLIKATYVECITRDGKNIAFTSAYASTTQARVLNNIRSLSEEHWYEVTKIVEKEIRDWAFQLSTIIKALGVGEGDYQVTVLKLCISDIIWFGNKCKEGHEGKINFLNICRAFLARWYKTSNAANILSPIELTKGLKALFPIQRVHISNPPAIPQLRKATKRPIELSESNQTPMTQDVPSASETSVERLSDEEQDPGGKRRRGSINQDLVQYPQEGDKDSTWRRIVADSQSRMVSESSDESRAGPGTGAGVPSSSERGITGESSEAKSLSSLLRVPKIGSEHSDQSSGNAKLSPLQPSSSEHSESGVASQVENNLLRVGRNTMTSMQVPYESSRTLNVNSLDSTRSTNSIHDSKETHNAVLPPSDFEPAMTGGLADYHSGMEEHPAEPFETSGTAQATGGDEPMFNFSPEEASLYQQDPGGLVGSPRWEQTWDDILNWTSNELGPCPLALLLEEDPLDVSNYVLPRVPFEEPKSSTSMDKFPGSQFVQGTGKPIEAHPAPEITSAGSQAPEVSPKLRVPPLPRTSPTGKRSSTDTSPQAIPQHFGGHFENVDSFDWGGLDPFMNADGILDDFQDWSYELQKYLD